MIDLINIPLIFDISCHILTFVHLHLHCSTVRVQLVSTHSCRAINTLEYSWSTGRVFSQVLREPPCAVSHWDQSLLSSTACCLSKGTGEQERDHDNVFFMPSHLIPILPVIYQPTKGLFLSIR